MKSSLFFLAFLVSGHFLAASDCSCNEVYFKGLYLQPNSSNLYYGAEALPLPVPTPNWKSLEIRPDYHFGFDLGVRTQAVCSNTQVQLNWERLHSSDSASTQVSIENMVGPYFNIGPDAQPYKIANGYTSHEFDAFNLNIRSLFLCCNGMKAYGFSGISFTRIKQSVHSYFSNFEGTITRDIQAFSQFAGAGPELGIDLTYSLCGNFSLISNASGALLVGTLKNHTTYESTTPLLEGLGITPPNTQETSVPNRTQVVPALRSQLGLSYAACFCNQLITLNIGYQVEAYLNAIQSVDMISEVSTPPEDQEVGVYALGFARTTSNFVLSGPFVSLNVAF